NVYSGSLTGYAATTGTTEDFRPNMRFTVNGFEAYTLSWSDGTNVLGTTPTAIVAVPETTTFTFTITDENGCTKSDDVEVSTIALPNAPIGGGSTQCGEGVPQSFVVTDFPSGSTNDFRWYDAPTGGNLLQTGGSIYTGS